MAHQALGDWETDLMDQYQSIDFTEEDFRELPSAMVDLLIE